MLTDQQMLQNLKAELDRLLERYKKTGKDEDLKKANEWRMKYAELDVKINGHKGAKS